MITAEQLRGLAAQALNRMDEKGETAAEAAESVTGGNRTLDDRIVRLLQGEDVSEAATAAAITIEKFEDGNERIREGRNGRIYVSQGRPQWAVIVAGAVASVHDLRRDAVAERARLEAGR